MHKRVLLAVLALVFSVQLALPISAQTPPFVFVDNPNSNVVGVPYMIQDADGRSYFAFQHTGDDVGNLYFQGPSTSDCQYVIYAVSAAVIPDQPTNAQLFNGQCSPREGSEIADFQALGPSSTVSIEAGITGGPGGTDAEEALPSCESQGALAWFACPLTNLLLNAVKATADFLSTFLSVQPLDQAGAAFTVWGNMRNIALALFVIGVIVVVFGQSLSIEAYTIKRMAPRLGVAAIGIMLSFYIAGLMIDLFNVMGSSLYALLVGALGGVEITRTGGAIAANYLGGTALLAGGIIGVISQGAFAFFVLILVPILIAFFTGFVVVLVRQVVLIMLVIISPIAIAAWVLPNTDQYFKRWWGLFTSLLMMYPIIMLLLASGTIFANIITNGEGTITQSNFLNHIIALLALAATVGMIPFTLKASSSLLGKVSGAMNNPNRGPIDRLRKAGQARSDYNKQERGREAANRIRTGQARPLDRLRTGTFGYGRRSELQRLEATAGAMDTETKENFLREKGFSDRVKAEAFRMQNMTNDQILTAGQAEGASDETQSAAFRMLAEQRGGAQVELESLMNSIAESGNVVLGQRLSRENYSAINEGAPHLAQYSYDRTRTLPDGTVAGTPNYSAIPNRSPEVIGKVMPRSMEDFIVDLHGQYEAASSMPAGAERTRALNRVTDSATQLIEKYAVAPPHLREAGVARQLGEVSRGGEYVFERDDPATGVRTEHRIDLSGVKSLIDSSHPSGGAFLDTAGEALRTSAQYVPPPSAGTPTPTPTPVTPRPEVIAEPVEAPPSVGTIITADRFGRTTGERAVPPAPEDET